MSQKVYKYYVRGDGLEFYCKITEIYARNTGYYTIMFGGKDTFCFSASINTKDYAASYIDRIEYEETCVKTGVLDPLGGTVKLVKCALWTIRTLFKHTVRFTLMDDSHIYCKKGSKEYKMSLAYDSIFKRNMTWYEHKFNAKLPPQFMEEYKKSLQVLDEPLLPYNLILIKFPVFHKYEKEYIESNTPREFVEAVRKKYGDKYCYELAQWLTGYAESLKIKYYKDDWFIDINDVKEPPGYEIYHTQVAMKGGMIKRNTRKNKGGRCIGYYGSEWV